MKRVLEIIDCMDCPHMDQESFICSETEKETHATNIPEWCPLPKADEVKNE